MEKYLRWLVALCIAQIMFNNHYTRDSVGALEKQLEAHMHISPHTYMDLNALYFIPNIITPLFAGLLIDYLGGTALCLIYSTSIASMGYVIFACNFASILYL